MLRQLFLGLSHSERAWAFARRTAALRPALRRFVAGETMDEGLAATAGLRAKGIEATLDLLGEATASEDDARRAARGYLEVLNGIFHRGLRSHVSLKLSQMGLDLSEDLAAELLGLIGRTAASVGTFVRVDMEDSGRLPATLRVFDRVWTSGARNLGIVLQAYLFRTPEDLERYNRLGVPIRLCKGAYAEPPTVAYPRKADVDAAYGRLAEQLLLYGNAPALATHDERLITRARDFATSRGVAQDRFEFQFLYGIRRDLQERLVAEGYRVRVYVPFGTHWYPYFMRRLAERPANVAFIARHLIGA
ncbi:MAG TPA: proline dehydrogenase family protein [bacterium]|nr:proline dehydrogenase family protein [bacterium]